MVSNVNKENSWFAYNFFFLIWLLEKTPKAYKHITFEQLVYIQEWKCIDM